ncbi:hypothetical protein C8Q77DRAFT_448179 [Trametes polyzona]|nr:hypothetical protein C8Q77DRAFT_448179 [Trametes polyzona]
MVFMLFAAQFFLVSCLQAMKPPPMTAGTGWAQPRSRSAAFAHGAISTEYGRRELRRHPEHDCVVPGCHYSVGDRLLAEKRNGPPRKHAPQRTVANYRGYGAHSVDAGQGTG